MDYSGLGRDRLKKLAEAGDIIGFRDTEDHNKWIFDRVSIDTYRKNQSKMVEVKVDWLLNGSVI